MRKFLFLTLMLSAIISANAQSGPQPQKSADPATVLQQMKEQQVPQLVAKTGLTEAQAAKVVEINFELRQSMMTGVRDLNEADRAKKIAEFKAAKEKKYSEIPLTADQIKAVYAFYEDMGKNTTRKVN